MATPPLNNPTSSSQFVPDTKKRPFEASEPVSAMLHKIPFKSTSADFQMPAISPTPHKRQKTQHRTPTPPYEEMNKKESSLKKEESQSPFSLPNLSPSPPLLPLPQQLLSSEALASLPKPVPASQSDLAFLLPPPNTFHFFPHIEALHAIGDFPIPMPQTFAPSPPPLATPPTSTSSVAPKNDLRFNSLAEFSKELHEVQQLPIFNARIEALQKRFGNTQLATIVAHQDADPSKCVYLKISFNPGPYFSKAFDKSKCFPGNAQNYHINIYECVGENNALGKPIMRIRASENAGELVWISQGQKVSGNTVADLYLALEAILGIDMYLFDDAQISLTALKKVKNKETGEEEYPKIYLKASHPIGRPDKKTWYQRKLDFRVARCSNWLMGNTELEDIESKKSKEEQSKSSKASKAAALNQDPESYDKALDAIRAYKLCDLYTFYRGYRETASKLAKIVRRVFGQKQMTLESCQQTLHDLEKALSERVQKSKTQKELKSVQGDQFFVHKNIFTSWLPDEKASKEEVAYCQNLSRLEATRVFVKFAPKNPLKVLPG